MNGPRSVLSSYLASLFVVFVAGPATAADPLTFSLGFSYLATGGNTDTSTAGFDAALTWAQTPWKVEAGASLLRAENEGDLTAQRTVAGVRGSRAMGERWDLTTAVSGTRDRFAGLDARVVVEAGVSYRYLEGPVHSLTLEAGGTWTRDDPVSGAARSFPGAMGAVRYAWKVSDTATLSERLALYPNLDDHDDWRLESDLAIEAAITTASALKVAYSVRRDNKPVPGYRETDSATSVTLVFRF